MKFVVDGKTYRVWFEYLEIDEPRFIIRGQVYNDKKTIAACALSDADQTWTVRKQVRSWTNEFRKIEFRKQALAKVLKITWTDRATRRAVWTQILAQMKAEPQPKFSTLARQVNRLGYLLVKTEDLLDALKPVP